MRRLNPEDVFTKAELEEARTDLEKYRAKGGHEPGKWMVNPLSRTIGRDRGKFPAKVVIRDITPRVLVAQSPRTVSGSTNEERLELIGRLAKAGVPEIQHTTRWGPNTKASDDSSVDSIRREIETAKSFSPHCKIQYIVVPLNIYTFTPTELQHLEIMARAGVHSVQILSAVYLGKANLFSVPEIFDRTWKGRDWRDMHFPRDIDEHIEMHLRQIETVNSFDLRACCLLQNMAHASEDYIARHCKAIAGAGAYEFILSDNSAGSAPEALARLVEVAKESAPKLRVGVHVHDLFGFAMASSIASARAGADVIETTVNGITSEPQGGQAPLAGTALALEAFYGVPTGIDLSQMATLAKHVSQLTGVGIPWGEPGLGAGVLEGMMGDGILCEQRTIPLLRTALNVEALGATRHRIGMTSSRMDMWEKLDALGIEATKDQVEAIMRACIDEFRTTKMRAPVDEDIRRIALKTLGR